MEKAEIIRAGYDAAVRGDLEAARAVLAPDARWHSALGVMLGQTEYVGFDAIVDLVSREIPSVLEGFTPQVLEIRDLGGDLALAVVRWRAKMRGSGAPIDQVFGQLCRVRDGKWVEMRSHPSVDAALAAVPELRARGGYDDWNRGDIEAVVAATHEDVVLEQDPGIPGAETVRGRAALREWLERFTATWEEFEVAPERVVADGGRVAVVLRLRAMAPGSGVRVETRIGHLLDVEGGLVRRWRTFTDPDAAVAEVGADG